MASANARSREGEGALADVEALRTALREANVPTLLMVHTQRTHDEAFLEKFAPHLHSTFSGIPNDVPPALEEELRERLSALLSRGGAQGEQSLPRALMQKMMSIGVGETVADEFVPLLLDQMALERPVPRTQRPRRSLPPPDFKVVVIGAGLGGIAAGVKLADAGYAFEIFEKNPGAGGTWWENRYPGVGVDTPSHFYSLSFALNPDWNHYHPKGRDMRDYLVGVVERFGLREHIRFETRVLACVLDPASERWRVTTQTGAEPPRTTVADAVFVAQGILNRPAIPEIPGLDRYRGAMMHSARWDERVKLAGKRVALIGTGASGAQIGPAIAPDGAHLTVFQRSRHWVLNNPEVMTPVTPGVKWALRHIPHYAEWFRFRVYWFAADGLFTNVLRDPAWPDQTLSVSATNEGIRQYCLAHYRAKLGDRPDLLEKLVPDFPVFAKRIVMDAGWLDTLRRENVTLEVDPIDHATPSSIVTKTGIEHPVDVIALATGFQVARMLGDLRVVGRGGRDLGVEWGSEDPRAYLGVMVPGFPNLFISPGPNSAPNHAAGQNLVSEAQVNYMIEALDYARAQGKRTIEPTQAAYDVFNARIEARMPRMIWSHPKAESYYRNSKGRVFLSWPYRLVDYWAATRGPNPDDVQLG
jgi:4-hydroxyacetophenone monooxygenase